MRKILFSLVVSALFGNAAMAQSVQRIAAIVNDEVISVYDLNARIRLVIMSTGLRDDARNRRRIAPEVLRALIDERLRMQEAKRRNISVSKREEQRALARLERANRLKEGELESFMARQGVDLETVRSQVRTSIAWTKLIRRRYQPRIHVSEEEIEEVLSRLRSSQGQEEYRISEIFLAVDSPEQEAKVRANARQLTEQIREGARFSEVARQFSQSATAAVGGDLGWLNDTTMPEHLREVVPTLSLRRASDPIRSGAGYHILLLRDRREAAGADPRRIKVTLGQLFVPVETTEKTQLEARRTDVRNLSASVSGCDALANLSRKLQSTRPSKLGQFVLADLAPGIRDAIKDLPVGKPSPPIPAEGGLAVFMVCKRDQPAFRLPPRAKIREQLTATRVGRIARRVLRDIRLAAVVDIRI